MASNSSRNTATPRYGARPDPGWRRLALIPGIIAAFTLLIGLAVLAEPTFIVVRYIVAIFALIVAVFAFQAKQWGWLPVFAIIAVAWNPIWPIAIPDPYWQISQYVAAIVFLVAGWLIRVPIPEDQRRAR